MATVRVTPPLNRTAIKVGGNSYTCAYGSTIDVPDFVAQVMEANGWHAHGADVTAARPKAYFNNIFVDTTLGKVIKADALGAWHDMITGAVV